METTDVDKSSKGATSGKNSIRMKIQVGEKEKAIVIRAHNARIDQGWEAVLKEVKANIEQLPLSSRVVQYYLDSQSNTAIRRIKRIVRESFKEATSKGTDKQPRVRNETDAAVEEGLNNQMRYAQKRTPAERKQDKMAHFVDSDELESEVETEEAEAENPRRKKAKTLREVTYEAQSAHKEMCQQAMSSMAAMNQVLAKLNSKIDDF